ncbi:hypothetical protein LWI28_009429 [Acer negundo]|uniref:ABC-2 type transporter transmembrane domain-containing protein n=1 Tax=Acer negundo TaxID=4023 RepID=A0AAD5IDZ7_ACENE|nr:hypothetical protein LWI28_009429 [Acer negundo]
MDEPTSGLDARAAAIVMRTVRNTVDTGRTVVCTIISRALTYLKLLMSCCFEERRTRDIVGPLGRRSSHVIKYLRQLKESIKLRRLQSSNVDVGGYHYSTRISFGSGLCRDLQKFRTYRYINAKHLDGKKRQDLFNAMGSMYGAVLFLGVQNAGSVQPVVAVERTVFYRERAAGM